MTIRKLLALDAVTCAVMGLTLTIATAALAELLSLPADLLTWAGVALVPIALFMAVLALQQRPWLAGVLLIVLGNMAWVLASVVVLFAATPNSLGATFVVAQAVVVAMLALAEFRALARRPVGVA